MEKIINLSKQGFTVLSLLLFSGGPITIIMTGGDSPKDGREAPSSFLLMQIIFLVIYTITLFLLIKRWKQVLNLLIKEKFIVLLIGLALVSIFWSDAPTFTLRRSVALAGTTLFGIYLATYYSLKQQLQLLSCTFGIAILLSFIYALMFPEYGVMGGTTLAGTWRGIYSHKNTLGSVMVLSASVFMLLAVEVKKRFLLWCGFSFSLVLLILSTSKSALASIIIILAALVLYWVLQKRYATAISCAIAVTIVSVCFLLQVSANIYLPVVVNSAISDLQNSDQNKMSFPSENLRTVTGENLTTFTGRTKLWPRVLDQIKERPLLGYGYNGFWTVTEEATQIRKSVGEFAKHSHNGFLDIWIDLGLVGMILFLTGFIMTLFRTLVWLRLKKTSIDLWPLLYLGILVLINLVGSNLLEQNKIFWVLYVAVVFSTLVRPQLHLRQKAYNESLL